jgi:enamidase
MGIDNIEHSFYAISDFVKDAFRINARGRPAFADVDMKSAPVQALIKDLVAKGVSYTSTLPAPETLTPGRPMPKGTRGARPSLKADFENAYQRMNSGNGRPGVKAAGPDGNLEERCSAR